MKSMFWLGLFGIIAMGALGSGKTAPAFSALPPSMAGVGHAAPGGATAVFQIAAADTAPAATVSATGVVQQIEPGQDRVKISHDAIPALGWPKMTMYFRVKDKAMLKDIAAGDAVRFELEKGAAGQTITRMEKVAK